MNQTPDQNQAIVNLLRAQDQEGLRRLYEQYAGALLHLIMRTVPAQELAEEVLQDAFVKIWQKIDQYDESKGRLFTWMAQIARRTAIDKSRSGEIAQAAKTDSIETLVSTDELGNESAPIRDEGLRRVLKLLDEDHQMIIDYLYFRGYSQSEASEALGLPLGTVKTRARKAILQLRKVLSKEILLALLIGIFK